MSGIQLQQDLSSLEDIAEEFARLGDLDEEAALDAAGAEMELQVRRRIQDEKTAPDGTPWAALSPGYKAKKEKKSSGGLLSFDGDLMDSIQHELMGGKSVVVGSNLVYAATHDQGDESRGIEQRQYLGLSKDNERDINDVLSDFIEAHLNSL